jgi:hypothetical protein
LLVDWDDTLLPTTYLTTMGISWKTLASDVPTAVRNELRKYAYRVKATLSVLEGHGQVVIVTNAAKGWIETSCARFLPEIEDLIRSFRRISARPTEFEEDEEIDPKEWKEEAFCKLAAAHFANPIGQPVFSLGDARWERDAVRMTSTRLGVVSQSLKLIEHPSIETLEKEHVSLQEDGYLDELLGRADGFDLCFDPLDGPRPWIEQDCSDNDTEVLVHRRKSTESHTETPKSSKSTVSTATTASTTSGDDLPMARSLLPMDLPVADLLCRGRRIMAF